MSKNSENKIWHETTAEEFNELLERLKAKHAAIADSYEYPFEDLLEYLEKTGTTACKSMRAENSDQNLHFLLHFASPAETWQNLCGIEGHYLVDPLTFRARLFELDSRN